VWLLVQEFRDWVHKPKDILLAGTADLETTKLLVKFEPGRDGYVGDAKVADLFVNPVALVIPITVLLEFYLFLNIGFQAVISSHYHKTEIFLEDFLEL
jgi:hypothetical protein